jgi:hypothetical protein
MIWERLENSIARFANDERVLEFKPARSASAIARSHQGHFLGLDDD